MASDLPAQVNVGQINACLIRIARLAADCSPLGGADTAYVTVGLSTFSSEPDVEEGTRYEPKNACGQVMYIYEGDDITKRHNLQGELWFFDVEGMFIMFGGEVVQGKVGSDFAGFNIGWASPGASAPPRNGVYLEIITQNIGQDAGDCASAEGGFPAWTGHIWGKAKLRMGTINMAEEARVVAFAGTAVGNPNLFDGPWNDYPGAGYIRNTPYQTIQYSQEEYEAILALAGPGMQATPAAS